jgi:hypothetical protein
MSTNRDGFDQFGNPLGRAFDLGGVDDERLRGERILLYVGYNGEGLEWHHVQKAVGERNIQMDICLSPAWGGKRQLDENLLKDYAQLWFVSDRNPTLSEKQIRLVEKFVDAGNGLLVWADNEPYYADANLLARKIINTEFSGNREANQVMTPGKSISPGHFIGHPLTQGVNNLYEGITICTIAPAPHLTILAQSHDGQMCMACYEQGNRRIVLDTGFTKVYPGCFEKSAGTPRYFRNIAFWLAKGSRGIEYIPFTPGRESIARINAGAISEKYRYTLKEPANLTYLLHWEGVGTLGLVVQNPQGSIVYDTSSAKSPIRVEIPATDIGDWVCWVKGISVAHPNFPYVLTLARSALETTPKVSKPISMLQPALISRKGKYEKQWGSTHPGLLIVLLDQSNSMNDPFGGSQLGAGKKKSDMVTTVINGLLHEFIKANTIGTLIKPRADIAVLIYEGNTARSVFKGALANRPFVSLSELNAEPLRVETRTKKELDDSGQVIEITARFPVWVEPVVGTATPMCAALRQARELAETWVKQHPNNYPPVVINITDGASTDGDPREPAQDLCEVGTSDGTVLLFNVYITDKPLPTIEFPSQAGQISTDPENIGSTLFAISSEIPATARKQISGVIGQLLPANARGLVLNGDAGSIRQMFVFATVGAQPIDPNR